MLLFLLACVLPAFWTSFLAVACMRWLAPRIGLIDKPGARKVHRTPTPLGGGVGIFLGTVLPVVFELAALEVLKPWLPPHLQAMGDAAFYKLPQLTTLLVGSTLLAVTGLIDDFRPIPWQPRLALQFMIAIALAISGVRATLFYTNPWIGGALSVLWIVVLVNSFNFLDNMDGLSGGIGLIVSTIFAAMMLGRANDPRWLVGGYLLLLAGALIGFLCHNWSPARIFMGDSGSYFLGASLASMTLLGTFYEPDDQDEHVILAPLCVLAVPLYDLVSVILIRLREGRSPFQADKRHFSHRLVAMGLKPVYAVLTVHLATLTTGLAGLLLYAVSTWGAAMLAVSVVLCVLAIIAVLESASGTLAPARKEVSLGAGPVVALAMNLEAVEKPAHQTVVSVTGPQS